MTIEAFPGRDSPAFSEGLQGMRTSGRMAYPAAQLGVSADQVEMLLVTARSQVIEGLLTVTLHTGQLVAVRMRIVVAGFAVLIETQEASLAFR